ncbi:hypothetical protein LXL04_006976 [Taraxacum kok-saghyz]
MQVPDSTTPLLRQLESIQEIGCEKAGGLELETTHGHQSTIKSVTPNAFEYIPEELIQHIQSHLPVKEAARTTVLSKSWRHAWSTNPTLSYIVTSTAQKSLLKQKKPERCEMKNVKEKQERYLRDNISIEKLDLEIDIDNWKSAYCAEKCIRPVATKTCLKEFSLLLTFLDKDSHFTLPADELLLSEKLTKIRFEARTFWNDDYNIVCMTTSLHPVIKCVSLRELDLHYLDISGEALNHILSSCTLLVRIQLIYLRYCFSTPENTIKVKNLPCLRELHIVFNLWYSPGLEISDVPNFHVFRYNINGLIYLEERSYVRGSLPMKANAHNVRELELCGVVPDYVSLDMITTGFPFLKSLTLCWKSGSKDLNSKNGFNFIHKEMAIYSFIEHLLATAFLLLLAELAVFFLLLLAMRFDYEHNGLYGVQIFAPKLLSFSFTGYNILRTLLFPVSSLRQIELSFRLRHPVDTDPLDFDIDDLRRRLLLPPATNVQQLDFQMYDDKCLQQRSPFFEAFFEICHPKHVFAQQDYKYWYTDNYVLEKNHFCGIMLSEVLEKKKTTGYWPDHLKHVLVRLLPNEKWEPLTISNKTFLDGSASVYFKLEWD